MKKIQCEADLVNHFIENSIYNDVYDVNDKIHIRREFVIIDQSKRTRVDLLLINETRKKVSLIEFKNRRLCPNDFFQIARYYRDFVRSYELDFEVDCVLIGRHTTSKDFNSIISLGIDCLKVYFFTEDEHKIKIFHQDKKYALLDLW